MGIIMTPIKAMYIFDYLNNTIPAQYEYDHSSTWNIS